jgi:hypothetical protein
MVPASSLLAIYPTNREYFVVYKIFTFVNYPNAGQLENMMASVKPA